MEPWPGSGTLAAVPRIRAVLNFRPGPLSQRDRPTIRRPIHLRGIACPAFLPAP